MGSDGMHLRVLKDLVDIIARPLSFVFDSFYQRRFPDDWKKANVMPSCRKEDPEHDRLVNLTLVSRKMTEQSLHNGLLWLFPGV